MIDLGQFLSGSQLIDAVIALTIFEGLALTAYYRITGRGVAPGDFALNMLSGLCLMFALRFALVNAGWMWVAASLSAAGLAHAADLAQRWRRQRLRF
ncbi:MAG: hypothetical protein H7228_00945 [Polaromonas sp.]|nr:hypothetical protein [Polaromonas sp.]